MNSNRATDSAKDRYEQAGELFNMVWAMKGRKEIDIMGFLAGQARAHFQSSVGDIEMATALRAIYIKLEEIERRLDRIRAG